MYFTEEPDHVRLLRDTMHRFVERELPRERVREWDRVGEAPREVFEKLAETGVCGLTIDEASVSYTHLTLPTICSV